MSHAAARAPRPAPRPVRTRTIRTTLGELVAAAFDAAGEGAGPAEVARVVKAVAGARVRLE